MPSTTHSRESRFTTRLVALVLLVAFVLQSAARASEGCIARAFVGSCCCVEVDTGADLGLESPAASSCCTASHADAEEERGPSIVPASACDCETNALPSVPTTPDNRDAATQRDHERVLRAIAVPLVSCFVAHASATFTARIVRPPPDPLRTRPRGLETTRGNSHRMSRLCVCLR